MRGRALAHTDGTVSSCPSENGARSILAFTVMGGRQILISTDFEDCGGLDNGVVAGEPSSAFDLDSITPVTQGIR